MASKSTPISQLPVYAQNSMPPQQQGFVNEPHRQLVTQAQQAQQSYSMPQSSSQEMVHDDDATVNDVLGCLQKSSPPQPQPQPQQPPPPPHMVMQQQTQSIDATSSAPPWLVHPHYVQQNAIGPASAWYSVLPVSVTELKIMAVCIVLFMALSVLPVSTVVEKYAPFVVENVPHADVLMRSIMMGIGMVIAGKVIMPQAV